MWQQTAEDSFDDASKEANAVTGTLSHKVCRQIKSHHSTKLFCDWHARLFYGENDENNTCGHIFTNAHYDPQKRTNPN